MVRRKDSKPRTGHHLASACRRRQGNHLTVRKRHSFFLEFSLCLSRACLGKMIIRTIKWRRKDMKSEPKNLKAFAHREEPQRSCLQVTSRPPWALNAAPERCTHPAAAVVHSQPKPMRGRRRQHRSIQRPI